MLHTSGDKPPRVDQLSRLVDLLLAYERAEGIWGDGAGFGSSPIVADSPCLAAACGLGAIRNVASPGSGEEAGGGGAEPCSVPVG
jgi:hypothetical protein